MRPSRARAEDERFERERKLNYRGTARVSLDVLQFHVDDSQELDENNVERLKRVFQREGCRRQFVSNHILVAIDQACLDTALGLSRVSPAALFAQPSNDTRVGDYPELQFPDGVRLTCLHGRHRIQAAREFLSARDKWWIADLYLTNSSSDVRRCLIEEYANEKIPTDGEIYRKIRHYHFQRNYSFESRWWARLRGCRARNLKSLLGQPEIAAGFDALLDVPGLWGGMQLTTLHKMLALRTDDVRVRRGLPDMADFSQEILNYLEHIRKFWYELVDDSTALAQIDDRTVQFLELRAPGASTRDAEAIQSRLRAAQIFSAFSDADRQRIFERLCEFSSLIPSLNTFFRDLVYWEACIGSVKHLITVSRRDTLLSAFDRHFTGIHQPADRLVIQEDEVNFVTIPGTSLGQVESGYRQIIAFSMRHFLDLPPEPVSCDVTVRPRVRAHKAVLRQFASLALRLGFESSQIRDMLAWEESAVSPIVRSSTAPVLVTSGPGEKLKRRSGLPVIETFHEDRGFLFLKHLHNDQDHHGEGITSFFVLKSIYLAYMGRLAHGLTFDGPNNHGNSESMQPNLATQERQERERQEQERERDRRARDQREQEQREQDRARQEHARQEQARQLREQQERQELEQREREQRELDQREQEQRERDRARQEQERQLREQQQWDHEQEQRELDQREQEQREQDRARQEQERQLREQQQWDHEQEQEQREQEQREQERRKQIMSTANSGQVCIHFKMRERGIWRNVQSLWVDQADASEVGRVAKKNVRKGLRLFDLNMHLLTPENCFEAVTEDGTNTIVLMPQSELDIDEGILDSAQVLSYQAIPDGVRSKRQAR